jgi:hypothetical protein
VGTPLRHVLTLRGAVGRVVACAAILAFLLSGFGAASHAAEHANAATCCGDCGHHSDSAPCDGEDGHDAGECALCRVAFQAGAPVVPFVVPVASAPTPTLVARRFDLVETSVLDRWPPARGPPHAPPA